MYIFLINRKQKEVRNHIVTEGREVAFDNPIYDPNVTENGLSDGNTNTNTSFSEYRDFPVDESVYRDVYDNAALEPDYLDVQPNEEESVKSPMSSPELINQESDL